MESPTALKAFRPREAPTVSVFALQLEGHKYYIGSSRNFEAYSARILDGHGPSWVQKYPLKQIAEIRQVPAAEEAVEKDAMVRRYFLMYGAANVRGGNYASFKLSSSQLDEIQRFIEWAERTYRPPRQQPALHQKKPPLICARCERTSHSAENCYARTSVHGEVLSCARCGRGSHTAENCYAVTSVHGEPLSDSEECGGELVSQWEVVPYRSR